MIRLCMTVLFLLTVAFPTLAQPAGGRVTGRIVDQTGAPLPGVTMELQKDGREPLVTVTSIDGVYEFDNVPVGIYRLTASLLNFASVSRSGLAVVEGQTMVRDEVLRLSLSAEVVVVGKRTFSNLADVENPAENLVGIASSASQGAITARQLEVRPFMRQGELLETVPGVIITQHSGEGKANQYYLRGFNLDHGSDFATSVAGTPVNMPTHAHSQGYSDLNFLIPELVAGVQYSKGPYFAEQGDFATAGASNVNYVTSLERPTAYLDVGTYGFGRVLIAASPRLGQGHLLAALETSTNDGPWSVPDAYRKINGVLRYSRGDNVNAFSLTAMGYHGRWNATEATPERAVASGLVTRYDSLDESDRGESYRYSVGVDWQRGSGNTLHKVQAFALRYGLDLFSNFTFYLDDPINGDQREQVDRRVVTGIRAFQKRMGRWRGHRFQNTVGVQLRNDDIGDVALYHTEKRARLATVSQASALVTTAGVYAENEIEWTSWLRATAGLRADGSRYAVTHHLDSRNSGSTTAGILSPKATLTLGPWKSTELYVNAGGGFHSNSALGTMLHYDANGQAVAPVTPLVRATGAEFGVRTVAVPHLQSTVSLWLLRLGSELVYNGDIGASEPGPASRRHGIEIANYYAPLRWLVFDGDVSLSQARFAEPGADGPYVPEAVSSVISGGVAVENLHKTFAALRWRYFGPRALVADNSVRSQGTTLLNAEGGYQLLRNLRANVQVYNLLDAKVSDIDYYFASRLPGEPIGGVDDVHFHAAIPRTFRVSVMIGF